MKKVDTVHKSDLDPFRPYIETIEKPLQISTAHEVIKRVWYYSQIGIVSLKSIEILNQVIGFGENPMEPVLNTFYAKQLLEDKQKLDQIVDIAKKTLAMLYYYGAKFDDDSVLLEKNPKEAFKLFESLTISTPRDTDVTAFCCLMYMNGYGVEQNFNRALTLLQKINNTNDYGFYGNLLRQAKEGEENAQRLLKHYQNSFQST